MTTRVAELLVRVKGDSSSATKAVDTVSTKTSKFSGVATKAGSIAGKALAGGLVLAAGAAVKMTQAAAADEQAQAKLANTLKSAAGATDAQVASVESWITAQGKALGVTDDELRPALGKLAAATHDVGKAQKLAALAMDVSAGSGKSLDSVSAALAKTVATGSVTALAKFGVATKNAKGDTLSMDAVLQKLGKTYKNAAADQADTAAGKAKILSVQFGELQESIGARLIPVLAKLTSIGLKVVDWIGKNQTLAGALIGTIGGLLAIVYVVSKAIAAWNTIVKVASALQTAWNFVMAANPIGLVVIAIAALGVAFVVAYKKSETFRRIVNAVLNKVKSVAGGVIAWFKAHWKQALFVLLTGPFGLAVILIRKKWGDIKAMPGAAFAFIKGKVKSGWADVVGMFKTAAGNLSESARTAAGNVVEAIAGVPGRVLNLGGKFLSLGKTLIGKFLDGLKQIGSVGATVGVAIANGIIDVINTVINAINSAIPDDLGFGPFHVDIPDTPISPIGHIGGGGSSKASSTSLAPSNPTSDLSLSKGGPAVQITIQGAVDPYSTGKQVKKLLDNTEQWSGSRIVFSQ